MRRHMGEAEQHTMTTSVRGLLLAAVAAITVALPVAAARAQGAEGTGLPLPRFVSLRSEQVNMRTGPGVRYPIDWVYMRRDLPVEVVQEFETWRKIRDPEGAEGWVHQSMLSGRRTVVTRAGPVPLRQSAADASGTVALLEAGVQGNLVQCPRNNDYCRVEVKGRQGWLKRDEIWGVYRTEFID
ncbi:SH3 domain-containing protein [Caenispirillum bisanense]